MSHVATAWAFSIRHLKPATKIVLLTLADCHNPEHGCFPSQAFIADACEMSERSVREHLGKLEELGLITRVHRDKRGTKFTSDTYDLHFDCVLAEPGKPAAKSAGRQNLPTAEYNNSRRQNLPPNPVREIGKTRAREDEATPCPVERLVLIDPGSHQESLWNEWLTDHGWPSLSELRVRNGTGYAMPYRSPPNRNDPHGFERKVTERFLSWASARMIERREAAA